LQSSEVQRDLGVLVHVSQKVSTQVQQVIGKANRMLLFIVRGELITELGRVML